MNLPATMNNLQSLQNFPQNISNNSLVDIFFEMLDKIVKRAIIHILNKHKQSFLRVVGKVVPNDIRRLAQIHNSDFLFNFRKKRCCLYW